MQGNLLANSVAWACSTWCRLINLVHSNNNHALEEVQRNTEHAIAAIVQAENVRVSQSLINLELRWIDIDYHTQRFMWCAVHLFSNTGQSSIINNFFASFIWPNLYIYINCFFESVWVSWRSWKFEILPENDPSNNVLRK